MMARYINPTIGSLGIVFLIIFSAQALVVLAEPIDRKVKESQSRIIVAGTGDSQLLLSTVAEYLETKYPDLKIDIPDTIGSGGGIKSLIAGKCDLARVARMLAPEEKKEGIIYQCFARSPIAFVVHPAVTGIDNLTTKQIIDIYSGKITNWAELGGPSGKIYPITRESGDSSLIVLHEHLPGFKEIPEPKALVIYKSTDMFDTLKKHKNTIGFIPMAMIKGTDLRILRVNGVYPSADKIASSEYPWVVPLGIVYKDQLRKTAKRFVDFLYTEDGQRIITEQGAVPISLTQDQADISY